MKAERETPSGGAGELSVEFELEWDKNGGDSSLEVGETVLMSQQARNSRLWRPEGRGQFAAD